MFPIHTKIRENKELIIREAQKEDAQSLIDHVNQIAGETDNITFEPGEFKLTVEEEQEILEKYSKASNQIFLIAEVDSKIAGISSVSAKERSRVKHIGNFGVTVKQDYWRQGVASALLEAVINWAKSTGIIRKINLEVYASNEPAITLYKKFGFEIEGTIRRDAFINGEFRDAYAMGLLID